MATNPEVVDPGTLNLFKAFFLVAALYDVILGVLFFFLYGPIFDLFDIELPYNTSYVHLTAGFIFVQGVGYWFVYRNMLRNVDIVKLGVVYKSIYTLVAVYYLGIVKMEGEIFGWFAVFDVLFIVGFVMFLMQAGRAGPEPEAKE